jgi:hypothetical protein
LVADTITSSIKYLYHVQQEKTGGGFPTRTHLRHQQLLCRNKKPIKNEKDNYGDEDRNSEMVNQAGKVGKAQHNFFR